MKTSILILDRSLAKAADTIAFFKVENDGFGLGAQRRAIDKNDLPQVQAELGGYLDALRGKRAIDGLPMTTGLIVPKTKVAENGDYNLSGERYREGVVAKRHVWPVVKLSEIIDELESGVSVNSTDESVTLRSSGILKTSCVTSGVFRPDQSKAVVMEELERLRCPVKANSIIISRMNTEALVGASAYINSDFPNLYLPDRLWQTVISRPDVDVRYVQYFLASSPTRKLISSLCGGTSGSMKNISKPKLLSIEIPLPPLEAQ